MRNQSGAPAFAGVTVMGVAHALAPPLLALQSNGRRDWGDALTSSCGSLMRGGDVSPDARLLPLLQRERTLYGQASERGFRCRAERRGQPGMGGAWGAMGEDLFRRSMASQSTAAVAMLTNRVRTMSLPKSTCQRRPRNCTMFHRV